MGEPIQRLTVTPIKPLELTSFSQDQSVVKQPAENYEETIIDRLQGNSLFCLILLILLLTITFSCTIAVFVAGIDRIQCYKE